MIKLKDLLAIMYPRTFIVLEAFRHNGLPEGYAEDLLETLDIDTEPIKQAIKETRDFNIYKSKII